MLRTANVFAAVAAFASISASGQATAAPRPSHAQTNWTGLYAGAQAGYDANADSSPFSSPFGDFIYKAAENGDLIGFYGAGARQFGNAVVGFDASILYDGARGISTCCGPIGPNYGGPDWKGMLRGSLGLAHDQFLFYATAGAAWMHYQYAVTTAPPFPLLSDNLNSSPWGWTVGGGVAIALDPHIVARLDYSYQSYDFRAKTSGFANGLPIHIGANTVLVGIAFKR